MRRLTQKQLDSLKLGRMKGIKKPNAGFKKGHIPWNKNLKGIHLSLNSQWVRGVIPRGAVLFERGHIPWNKGKVISYNYFLKQKENEYKALHKRIGRKFVKKGRCEFCGQKKRTEWANKNNNYLEIKENWLELCRKCHNNYDRKRIIP